MTDFSKDQKVQWNWGNGTGEGTIVERYTSDVTKTLKGSEVTRNATDDNPAFLIEQEDGDQVLKSASELKAR